MVLTRCTGAKRQGAAVWSQQKMYFIDGDKSFVILLGRRLITFVIVDGELNGKALIVFFDHDAALLINDVGPGIHQPLKGSDFR